MSKAKKLIRIGYNHEKFSEVMQENKKSGAVLEIKSKGKKKFMVLPGFKGNNFRGGFESSLLHFNKDDKGLYIINPSTKIEKRIL